ncbi:hypothetical protein [Jannaschia sp. CCS1]|uniref:hypothetical protein n=1 Tax=Jannaschia sp. (strain CCS1) TaxID=290400 RepID=UPI000053B3F3|nr:hypothetical protein [Jannaschia sp. CCS1]ABD53742.1 hypothetical protein Jann_0825 [Jannaschia sp. CCS1]
MTVQSRTLPIVRSAACGFLAILCIGGITSQGRAQTGDGAIAQAASEAFAAHCFSPFMTAGRAQEVLAATGARVDFYDLDPFSNAAPSPVTGRAATQGTDRRCEVAFDGDHAELAVSAAVAGLQMEGIDTVAPVPDRYRPTDGTALLGALFLNPRRIAVVHVGTRPGPRGVETFMFVERMTPLEPVE